MPLATLSRLLNTGWVIALLASDAQAQVTLDGLWVRAMPPTQSMTAAYGSVTNHSEASITIRGASAPFAGSAALHSTLTDGSAVRMTAMGDVTLAPGEVLTLSPGGGHIMLMDIDTMPSPNSQVQICFETDGQRVCGIAKVLRNAPQDDHDGHHHHMNH